MHKEDIKSVIRKRHGSLTAFEVKQNLAPGSVKDVLRGRSSAPVEAAIATEVRKPVQDLFPARYRRDSSTKVDGKRTKRYVHRLTGEAR